MAQNFRGVDTRNNILKNSLALFSKSGYDATSVAQICQQAQVSKGAFYHHFPSKQDLFLALMTTWLEDVDGLFQAASASASSVPEALENMAVISGSFFDELQGGFPILLEFWRQASRRPVVWERAVAPYHRYLEFFSGVIQAGIDEGAFHDSLDTELTGRILMAVAMGLLLQASFDPEGADWQATTRAAIKMVLNGMRRTA